MNPQVLGWIATTLFTVCYIPQIYKIVNTKKVEGVSIWMFVLQFIANVIALSYAVLIQQGPLQVKYILALLFLAMVIFVYYRYGKAEAQ